jgi:hypothetical protein
VAPITPLLVLPVAALLSGAGSPVTRAGVWVLGTWAGWLSLRVAAKPSLWFWEYGALFEPKALQPAHAFFPGYFHPAPGSVTRSLLWLGLLGLLPLLDWARRGVRISQATMWRSFPVVLTGGILLISIASYALG